MRISELERRTGVPARLLRYYEEQALLTPHRDARSWRVYTDDDERRVREIRTLIDSGLPTAAIRRLLNHPTAAGSGRSDRISEDLLVELTGVRNRLDARIRCLIRNRDALDAWLHEARPSGSWSGRTSSPNLPTRTCGSATPPPTMGNSALACRRSG